jgi:hypothetical protein
MLVRYASLVALHKLGEVREEAELLLLLVGQTVEPLSLFRVAARLLWNVLGVQQAWTQQTLSWACSVHRWLVRPTL